MTDDFESMIHAQLDEMIAWLATLTKEQRLKYFKDMFLKDYLLDLDDTTYIVRQHYSTEATETLAEKAERLTTKF